MNSFSELNDFLSLSHRQGVFLKTPTDQLLWSDINKKRWEGLGSHSDIFGVIESDCALKVFMGLLQHWTQGRSVLILDPALPQSRKQEIISLMDTHLTKAQKHSVFLLSSGTSGHLKIIGHDFASLCASAKMSQDFYGTSYPDHWGLTLPLHHVGGLMILWRMFISGGRVSKGSLSDLLQKKTINGLSLVPTQLQSHLDQKKSLSQLRLILLGGAACSQALYDRIIDAKLPVSLTYGSTETCSQVFATMPLNQESSPARKPHVGKALPQVHVIAPKQHNKQEVLTLKTPTLFHLLITESGLQVFEKNRNYQTTDLALFNQEHQLEIIGRSDQVFISGGENVSPESLENRLKSCPGLQDALIVARPDEKFGMVSHLFYESSEQDGSIRQKLRDYFQQELLPYERPKSFSRMPEEFKLGLKLSRKKAQTWVLERSLNQHPMVLFLHGFMGTLADFDQLIEQLIALGATPWQLKAVNLPGHAKTELNSHNFDQYLEEVIQSNPLLFQRPYYLYGYSLGARISFQLAVKSPSHCLGLILEAGHFGLENENEKKQREQQDRNLFDPHATDEQFEKFLNDWYQLPLFQGLTAAPLFKAMKNNRSTAHIRSDLYRCLQATSLAGQKTSPQQLKDLPFKTHYFTGELDQKYTDYGKLLQQEGLVEHMIISQASHNIHLMNPKGLAKKVIEILRT